MKNINELKDEILGVIETQLKNIENVKAVFDFCFSGHGYIVADTTGLYHVGILSNIKDDAYICTKADWDWMMFAGDCFLADNPEIRQRDAIEMMANDIDYLAAMKSQIIDCMRKTDIQDYRAESEAQNA